jgi:hypothetical protein
MIANIAAALNAAPTLTLADPGVSRSLGALN